MQKLKHSLNQQLQKDDVRTTAHENADYRKSCFRVHDKSRFFFLVSQALFNEIQLSFDLQALTSLKQSIKCTLNYFYFDVKLCALAGHVTANRRYHCP